MTKHTPEPSKYLDEAHALALSAWRVKFQRGFIDQDDTFVEVIRKALQAKDTRIAALEAELTEERAKVERLRDVVADLIAGGESAEQADPRLGYIELQTDRETLARAREALAATEPNRREGGVMVYGGPLFGRLAGKYVDLDMHSDDVDKMERELSSLRSALAEKTAQVERLRDALTNIYDYGLDRDGEYEAERLGELVDELVKLAREALAATALKDPK